MIESLTPLQKNNGGRVSICQQTDLGYDYSYVDREGVFTIVHHSVWAWTGCGDITDDVDPGIDPSSGGNTTGIGGGDSPYAGSFKMKPNDQRTYPKFTQVVKNLYGFVNNDPKVKAALLQWSGFTEAQLMSNLQFGQGPEIVVKQLSVDPIYNDVYKRFGYFNKFENPNAFNISKDWVQRLEQSNTVALQRTNAFILAVTILHESVHQARAANGLEDNMYEYGEGFEIWSFKTVIDSNNSYLYSYRFYFKEP